MQLVVRLFSPHKSSTRAHHDAPHHNTGTATTHTRRRRRTAGKVSWLGRFCAKGTLKVPQIGGVCGGSASRSPSFVPVGDLGRRVTSRLPYTTSTAFAKISLPGTRGLPSCWRAEVCSGTSLGSRFCGSVRFQLLVGVVVRPRSLSNALARLCVVL